MYLNYHHTHTHTHKPQIHPKLRGEYGQFGIDTIIIDDMPDTLISVSQLCEGGKTENQNIV